MAALQLLAALGFPALALLGVKRFKPLEWLGPVGLCYLAGLVLGNLPGLRLEREVSLQIAQIAVPLSIPLLLFATDLTRWVKLARPILLAFALACVAAVLSASAFGVLFRSRVEEAWKVAGMLVGVYVGGTSNMTAIGLALETRQETFVLLNAADLVLGGAYLFFVLTVAQRVLWKFLPRFRPAGGEDVLAQGPLSSPQAVPMLWALGASLTVGGLSAGITRLAFGELVVPTLLLLITTLGLAGSFWPRLRHNRSGYALGEYLLLSFCVAMGSLADLRELTSGNLELFSMVAGVLLATITLHYLLCALFRLDSDVVLITSTAAIFGPAFIGPVARALKNRELVAGGITTALVGLAVANYLGLATAWMLRP